MRLSLSWIHYRAHTYFKLAGRGYECLFGTADFALEKGRWYSVAKLAEWFYTTKPVAYFHMATHLVMLTLRRCPNFFSVQRLLAFARSFNTFRCMLQRTGKLTNWCIQIAAIGWGPQKWTGMGPVHSPAAVTIPLQKNSKQTNTKKTQTHKKTSTNNTKRKVNGGPVQWLSMRKRW